MLGGGSFTLFHVRGIRIAVDWSWFLILFFLIFTWAGAYGDALDESSTAPAPFALALASALGFFGSILLHELGHAFAALRRGIGITSIQLWIFGGVATLDRESDTPRTEFEVAAAGPAVTLGLIGVFYLVGSVIAGFGEFAEVFRLAIEFKTDPGVAGVVSLFSWLAMINALLLAFNLLPAFPMDGGRIARALIWWRTGSRTKATRIAATMGRGFGYLFIIIGFALIASGDIVSGIWLGFVGFMINGAARGAAMQTALTSRIDSIRVADVMDREPVTIPGDISVERALDEYFLRYRWPWFPVVDAAHRFLGLVQRDRADEVPEVSRASSHVSDLVDADRSLFVRDDTPLDALLSNQNLRKFGALMAVDGEGRLSGVITVEQVGRALRDA
ncbi:MAG TPA: site-2 protease family protein [Solirubrobacterales bacterium]|jgi:Zn-dependent protease|nr:site-2 protease family protein [Solirubrobacterales bacterium]